MDHHNPMRVVKHIIQPALFLNAEDDPLCVIQNTYENVHLVSGKDTDSSYAACGAIVITTKTGSHTSYLENKYLAALLGVTRQRDDRLSGYIPGGACWSERIMGEWFDAVLEEVM